MKPDKSEIQGVTRSLLQPSAELLGSHLRAFLEERIDDWRQRHSEKNLSRLLAEVLQSEIEFKKLQEFASERWENMQLISEWADGAQYVDEEDEELAALWREILREIIAGRIPTKIVIEKLKELRNYEAALLVRFASASYIEPSTDHERYVVSSLHEHGLVERNPFSLVLTGVNIFMVSLLAFGVFIGLVVFGAFQGGGALLLAIGLLVMVVLLFCFPFAYSAGHSLSQKAQGKYQLTWLGRALVRPLKRKEFEDHVKTIGRMWQESVTQDKVRNLFDSVARRIVNRIKSMRR